MQNSLSEAQLSGSPGPELAKQQRKETRGNSLFSILALLMAPQGCQNHRSPQLVKIEF